MRRSGGFWCPEHELGEAYLHFIPSLFGGEVIFRGFQELHEAGKQDTIT
jgi:hypothetical protein